MADEKSCEGKLTTLECMRCGHRETFSERQFKTTDGLSCEACKGPTIPSITKPGELVRNRRTNNQKSDKTTPSKGLTVKVDIDVSEALKGLKAVQRETKNTVRALKEVEELSDKRIIDSLTDDEIFVVLSSRGWEIETAVLSDGFGWPYKSSINMYKNHKQ